MRVSLVISLMTLLVVSHMQHDGLWLTETQGAVRAEANADAISLQADAAAIRIATIWVRSQWADTRADLKEFRADVRADARRCGAALKRRISSLKRADSVRRASA
jgi:hypothetical protein